MTAIAPNYFACVVFLYPTVDEANGGVMAGGSGFILGVPFPNTDRSWHLYVVTNKHVVDTGNHVIRVNATDGGSRAIPSQPDRWTFAVDDDLAVLPFEPPVDWAPGLLSTDTFLDESCEIEGWPIYPGDEAIFFGRFVNHEGHQRNKPVVRFGNIAMLPDRDALICIGNHEQLAFLVECRSLSGFSGSPAFVSLATRRWMGGITKSGLSPSIPKFLGVDCAHLPFWSGVCKHKDPRTRLPEMWSETNSGMAVVIPAWRLLNLINLEHLVKERQREEEEVGARNSGASSEVNRDASNSA